MIYQNGLQFLGIDLKDCDLKLKKETIHRQISSYPNQTP